MNQVIKHTTPVNKILDQDQLRGELAQFTGTEKWYRHGMNRKLIYTDGVNFFAENGGQQGAYWFIDKIAFEIMPLLKQKNEAFGCITLSVGSVDETKAMVLVTDGNNHVLATYHIHYTDMQTGDWQFYLIDDQTHITLLLPSEY